MKTFYKYLKSFVSEHFDTKLYLFFFSYSALLISLNYIYQFEDSYLRSLRTPPKLFLGFTLTQAVGYYGIILFLAIYRKEKQFVKSPLFWFKTIVIIACMGLDRSLIFYDKFPELPYNARIYLHRSLKNISWVGTLIIPALFLYFIWDRKHMKGFYGLTIKNVNFKPYFNLLWIVILLTFIASFNDGFQHQYPIFKMNYGRYFVTNNIMPQWLTTVIFEICYLIDFVSIELLFRGLLIHSLVTYLGKDAILPMATMYATIHFGKPMGETISSLFGGYILGVFSYYSRNIWGGVFLHMGLALFMEIFAFMQLHYL